MSAQNLMNGRTRELHLEENVVLPLTGVHALHARVYAGVEAQFNETIHALGSRKKIAGMVEECQVRLRERLPKVINGALRKGGVASREDVENVVNKIGKAISAERGKIGASITKPLLSAMSLYKQQFGDALSAAIPAILEPQQEEQPEVPPAEESDVQSLDTPSFDTQPADEEASSAPAADIALSLSDSMCLLCDCKTTFQQKEFLSRGLVSLFVRKYFAFVETLRPADGCVTLTDVRWLKKRWSAFAKKLEAAINALDSLSLENIRIAVAESSAFSDESLQHSALTSEPRSLARFAEDFSKRFVVGAQEYVQKVDTTTLLADIGIPVSQADIELSDIQLLLLPQHVNAEEDPPFSEREIELLRRNPDAQKSQKDFKRDVLQNDNALAVIARECNNELHGGLQVRTIESMRRMLSIFHAELLAGKDVFVLPKVHSGEETTPQVLLSENASVDHPTTNEEIDNAIEETNLPAEGDPPSEAELAFLIEEVGRLTEVHEGKDVSLSMFNHEACQLLANNCNEKFYGKKKARKVPFVRRFVDLLISAIDAGEELETFILGHWVDDTPMQEEDVAVVSLPPLSSGDETTSLSGETSQTASDPWQKAGTFFRGIFEHEDVEFFEVQDWSQRLQILKTAAKDAVKNIFSPEDSKKVPEMLLQLLAVASAEYSVLLRNFAHCGQDNIPKEDDLFRELMKKVYLSDGMTAVEHRFEVTHLRRVVLPEVISLWKKGYEMQREEYLYHRLQGRGYASELRKREDSSILHPPSKDLGKKPEADVDTPSFVELNTGCKEAFFTLTSSDSPPLITREMSAEELLAVTSAVQDTVEVPHVATAAVEKSAVPKSIGERIQEIGSQVSTKYGLNALVEKQAFSLKETPTKAVRVHAALVGLSMFVKNLGTHFHSHEASQGTVRLYVSLEKQANERAKSQLSSVLPRDAFVAYEKTLNAAFVEFEQRILAELQPSLPEGDADAELTAFFSQGGHVWVDEVTLHFLRELADTLSHISAPKAKTQFQARRFASVTPIKFKNTPQHVRDAKMRRLQALTINFLSAVSEKLETFTTQALCNDTEYGAMLEPLLRSSQIACGRFRIGDPLSSLELRAIRDEFDLALERARDRLVQLQRQRVSATSATNSNLPVPPDLPIPSESLAEHDGACDGFVRITIPDGHQDEMLQIQEPVLEFDAQSTAELSAITKARAGLEVQKQQLEVDRASIDAQRAELEQLRNVLVQQEQCVAAEGQRLATLAVELETSRTSVANDQETLALQKRVGEIQLREIEELRTRVGEQLERVLQESDQVVAQRKLLDEEVRKLQDDKLAVQQERARLVTQREVLNEEIATLQQLHEELEEERNQFEHERDEAPDLQQEARAMPPAKSILREREVTVPARSAKGDKTSKKPRTSGARKGATPQSTDQALPPLLKAAWAEADAHAKTMVNAMMQLDVSREFASAFIVAVRRSMHGTTNAIDLETCRAALRKHFPEYDPDACLEKTKSYASELRRRNKAMESIEKIIDELPAQHVEATETFRQKKASCEQVRMDLSAELEGQFFPEDQFMEQLISASASVEGFSLNS